jgi:hypothetical protein
VDHYTDNQLVNVYTYLRSKKYDEPETWDVICTTPELQDDGHSCGLFVCRTAKALVLGKPNNPFIDSVNERYKTMWELMYGKIC